MKKTFNPAVVFPFLFIAYFCTLYSQQLSRLLPRTFWSYPKPSPLSGEPRTIVFEKSEQILGDMRTFGIAMADIDQDNDEDVFTTNYIGDSKIWLNEGTGRFSQSSQSFDLPQAHGVYISDLNGDRYPDIFLLSHAASSKVYFNNRSGFFIDSQQSIGSAEDSPGMIAMADVDSDGDLDAFISYYTLPNRLWLNDGRGIFTITETRYGEGGDPGDMALVDVNGDTYPDLFLCITEQPDEIWLNDGAGKFTNTGQKLGGYPGNDHLDAKDIDGDGDVDIVVANNREGIHIFFNQKNTGIFADGSPNFEQGAVRCKLFDADLDGDYDLITTHPEKGNKLWLNDGSGSFTCFGTIFGKGRVLSIGCGDIDSDGDDDVILGKLEGTGGNEIYFNK